MQLIVDIKRHEFSGLSVLEEILFEVPDGEIVAIIGPSGCGKSTLLSIVGGILAPTDGRVFVEGVVPKESLNPITYIFQDFALLPWRNVYDNVAIVLEHHQLREAARRAMVEDVLRRTKLLDFARAYPKQLSGGMKQRVGIARALVVKPALLLMDEPLSALDAQTRDLLMEDFLALWVKERISALYVTHNFAEALKLANRVVVLSRRPGRIKELVDIPIPQQDRSSPSAQSELMKLGDDLWRLIKDEASSADREMANV